MDNKTKPFYDHDKPLNPIIMRHFPQGEKIIDKKEKKENIKRRKLTREDCYINENY
jgi:hypothetical protein